jgi:hypothetical protein
VRNGGDSSDIDSGQAGHAIWLEQNMRGHVPRITRHRGDRVRPCRAVAYHYERTTLPEQLGIGRFGAVVLGIERGDELVEKTVEMRGRESAPGERRAA